jgi:MerR family transcriptional regulator, mercuric resistance operon regulatory protein
VSAGLRSGQVAAAAGVKRQTLRYYERRGLIAEPKRTLGGHRMYSEHAITVLRVIKAAQRAGFSLEEVAELLEAGRHRHGQPSDRDLPARATAKLADVQARIADLELIAATLRAALEAGCEDLIECAAIDGCPLPFAEPAGQPGRPVKSSDASRTARAGFEQSVEDRQ